MFSKQAKIIFLKNESLYKPKIIKFLKKSWSTSFKEAESSKLYSPVCEFIKMY